MRRKRLVVVCACAFASIFAGCGEREIASSHEAEASSPGGMASESSAIMTEEEISRLKEETEEALSWAQAAYDELTGLIEQHDPDRQK